jgi:hypothetical protein
VSTEMCINMKYGCNILYMHHTRRCAMISIMSSCWPMDILTSAFFLRRTGSHQNLVNFCIWPKLWKCSGQNFQWPCPLVICYIAMENGHLQLIYPLKMVIIHSFLYVYQRVSSTTASWSCHRDLSSAEKNTARYLFYRPANQHIPNE